jgi:histone arginine demethylase JMJD6
MMSGVAHEYDMYSRTVHTYYVDSHTLFLSQRSWWLVGPERSGTCIHIDPLGTNAWNTLIVGQKRWVLFPPNVRSKIYKGKGLVRDDEDDEAIHYFMYILPRIKRKAKSCRDQEDYKNFACYEFTQNPGETVFVPNGWSHAVLNLSHTVGITQNFCSRQNFDTVWCKTRSGRARMAWKWLGQLQREHPELAERARQLNERDSYRMKYDPVEIKRRDEEKKRRKKEHRADL